MRPRPGVLPDVAQDIGQLERHAALLGQRQRLGGIEAEDVDDGQPHHRSHLVAVAVQLVEGLETARLQVARHAVDHLVEILVRDAVARHGVVERGPAGVPVEAAFERLVQLRRASARWPRALAPGSSLRSSQ